MAELTKILFVWQSSRAAPLHRKLIRAAAIDACKRITLSRANPFRVGLEEAGEFIEGMCEVPNSLLRSIRESEILLVDLTSVTGAPADGASRSEVEPGRDAHMPSVRASLALGYAAHALGMDRLVGVMNDFYGGPSDRLLDVKQRWLLRFRLDPSTMDAGLLIRTRRSLSRMLEGVFLTRLHHTDQPGRGDPQTQQFNAGRRFFEEKVRTGQIDAVPQDVASIAISIAPERVRRLELSEVRAQLASLEQVDGDVEPFAGGVRSVGGTTFVELSTHGEFRMASPENLNAARAGFPLPPNTAGLIPCNILECHIILSVHRYCSVLHTLDVPFPWRLGISLLGIHGFTMVVGQGKRSDLFEEQDLILDPVIIRDYDEIADIEDVAALLKSGFDQIWREFGFSYSLNYDHDGNWNREIMASSRSDDADAWGAN